MNEQKLPIPDRVSALLRQHFGPMSETFVPIKQTSKKWVFRAVVGAVPTIIKVFEERTRAQREWEVIRSLPRSRLRIAEPLNLIEDSEMTLLLERAIPGTLLVERSPSSAPDLPGLAHSLIDFYQAAAALSWPAMKFWHREGLPTTSSHVSDAWVAYFKSRMVRWHNKLQEDSLIARRVRDSNLVDRFAKIMANLVALEKYHDACLVHGDLTSRNILFDPPSATFGLIDFGAAMVAPPVFDIAKFCWLSLSADQEQVFLQAWSETSHAPNLEGLTQFKHIHAFIALAWLCDHYEPTEDCEQFFSQALTALQSPTP